MSTEDTSQAVSGTPIRAGVMGWPISHSLSPRLHGFWLEQYGINGTYEAIPVEPDDFAKTLRRLADDGFAGVNITVPHKEAALDAVDAVDYMARRLGAVNTVVVGADGRLMGSNTDGFGFMENLHAGAPDWKADAGAAVVLGAGGAARAIVAALMDAGVSEIRLINRTRERAVKLADDLDGRVRLGPVGIFDWGDRGLALSEAALLVNTTTLGMAGQSPLEIDLAKLPTDAVVSDIVYTPLETDLLAQARRRGNVCVDGIGMLLHQARPGFAGWFGPVPDTADGLPEVDAALREHVLAGMS